MGIESATFLETDKINKNFQLSIKNLKNCDLISCKGINAALILKEKHWLFLKRHYSVLRKI